MTLEWDPVERDWMVPFEAVAVRMRDEDRPPPFERPPQRVRYTRKQRREMRARWLHEEQLYIRHVAKMERQHRGDWTVWL
jgi:hypothetical protein